MAPPRNQAANRENKHRPPVRKPSAYSTIFAARVADTGDYGQSRHYASMVIDGDGLHVLSRSGDGRALDAYNGNPITFHTVKDFRDLVY